MPIHLNIILVLGCNKSTSRQMKKNYILTFSVIFCFAISSLSAQFEVKFNPISALFSTPTISAEYVISEQFGFDLNAGLEFGTISNGSFFVSERLNKSGYRFRAMARYYLVPREGGDWYYLGVYGGTKKRETTSIAENVTIDNGWTESVFTYGFAVGFKWVTKNNFLVELNGGVGRAFNYEFNSQGTSRTFRNGGNIFAFNEEGNDLFAKATVGYRF